MSDEDVLRSALRAGPDCPPLETMLSRLQLAPNNPLRVETAGHLEHCPHCAAEWRLLQQFEAGPVSKDEVQATEWIAARLKKKTAPETEKRKWWSLNWVTGLSAAAAVALVVLLMISQWNVRSNAGRPLPEFGSETLRSESLEPVQDHGKLSWKAVAGAAKYEITFRYLDGTTIFHDLITNPQLQYPELLATAIASGKSVTGQIVARDKNGTEIRRSGVFRLRRQG